MWTYNYPDELYHHGVKGMKWGVRRYQNKDGSLTAKGRQRYSDPDKYERANKIEIETSKKRGFADRYKNKEVENFYNSSKDLQKAKDKYVRVQKDEMAREQKFYKSKEFREKYGPKYAKILSERYPGQDYETLKRGVLYDDLDRGGRDSSYDLYLRDKGSSYEKVESRIFKAGNEFRDACKKATDSYVGQYKDRPITDVYTIGNSHKVKYKTTVSKYLEDAADDMAWREILKNG